MKKISEGTTTQKHKTDTNSSRTTKGEREKESIRRYGARGRAVEWQERSCERPFGAWYRRRPSAPPPGSASRVAPPPSSALASGTPPLGAPLSSPVTPSLLSLSGASWALRNARSETDRDLGRGHLAWQWWGWHCRVRLGVGQTRSEGIRWASENLVDVRFEPLDLHQN